MKRMTGNETNHDMRLRAHKLDRKMRNDHRHQFVTERAGESFTDALTRTREAMVDWTDFKTLMAQMASAIPHCDDEAVFRLEALMDETKQILKGLENDYPIVARLATINDRTNREESAFHREASRKRTELMTEQELADSKANVERMEAIYCREYPEGKDYTDIH